MIVGVGIDMIEVERMAAKVRRDTGFKENTFHKNEIEYCDKQADPAQHYAARFACKEAFLKAAGVGLLLGTSLCDIEIHNDASGKPAITLHNAYSNESLKNKWTAIHVSLSHVRAMGCAVVVIEK